MAKGKNSHPTILRSRDLSAWNFVIFLTLAFILLVLVLTAMNKMSFDLRSRATEPICGQIVLPRPEACRGTWTYKRDSKGCPSFSCEVKKPTR